MDIRGVITGGATVVGLYHRMAVATPSKSDDIVGCCFFKVRIYTLSRQAIDFLSLIFTLDRACFTSGVAIDGKLVHLDHEDKRFILFFAE